MTTSPALLLLNGDNNHSQDKHDASEKHYLGITSTFSSFICQNINTDSSFNSFFRMNKLLFIINVLLLLLLLLLFVFPFFSQTSTITDQEPQPIFKPSLVGLREPRDIICKPQYNQHLKVSPALHHKSHRYKPTLFCHTPFRIISESSGSKHAIFFLSPLAFEEGRPCSGSSGLVVFKWNYYY